VTAELLRVDQEKCVGCGLCAEVCPTGLVSLEGSSWPRESVGKSCIACGHCVAVCPEAALDHLKAPLANQVAAPPHPLLDEDSAALFLRSRRSIRRYKPEAVPRQRITKLLEVARLAPTGGNSQGVSYLVLDDPATLKALTAATIGWMEELIAQGSPSAPYFRGNVKTYRESGQDVILRGAPCLILGLAPQAFLPRGRDNTHFSLGYAELYAPTLGLGTCWSGFLESCAASGYAPLLEILKLPAGLVVTGGLMVGIPAHSYVRLPDRQPLQVIWGS